MEQGIRVYLRSDGNDLEEVWVLGHAQAAPYGFDIVCAGVSTLTQTALTGMQEYSDTNFEFRIGPGYFWIKLTDNPNPIATALLGTMILGLRSISESYAEFVTFEEGLPS